MHPGKNIPHVSFPFFRRTKLCLAVLFAFPALLSANLSPALAFDLPNDLKNPDRLGGTSIAGVSSPSESDTEVRVTGDTVLYNAALKTENGYPMTIVIDPDRTLTLETELGSGGGQYNHNLVRATLDSMTFQGGNLKLSYQGPATDLDGSRRAASYILYAEVQELTLDKTNLDIVHSQNGIRANYEGGKISVTGSDSVSIVSDVGETQHHAILAFQKGEVSLDADTIGLRVSGDTTDGTYSSTVQVTEGGKSI